MKIEEKDDTYILSLEITVNALLLIITVDVQAVAIVFLVSIDIDTAIKDL